MTVNLGNFHKQNQPATSLLTNTDFLYKNKITVNNPTQAHFSVEGVQSYAPQQIKAMKLRQDRLQESKQGAYVPLKTVLLSDQLIQWPQEQVPSNKDRKNKKRPESAKEAKFYKMKQPSDEPLKQYLKKRHEQRINKKNAVSTNNQAIVKLEKNIAKKEALEYKLQKMQKQYQQFFKDVKLGEKSMKKFSENDDSHQQSQISLSKQIKEEDSKIGKSVRPSTTKFESKKEGNFDEEISENNSEQMEEDNDSRKSQTSQNIFSQMLNPKNSKNKQKKDRTNSLNVGFDLINNCTSYSQKLGTAIHQMFG